MRHFIQRYSWAAIISVVLAGSLQADIIISAQFQGTGGPMNYQGVEPDAAAADPVFANSDQWNHFQPYYGKTFTNLVTSTGANSGASLYVNDDGGYNDFSHNLPDTYFYYYESSSTTFTISGLAPNESFTLFLYAFNSVNSANDRGEIFTVGGSTFNTATGNPSSLDPTHAVDGLITGVTGSDGTISGTWAFDPSNVSREIDWSGFQLDVSTASATAPEPGTLALLAGGLGLMASRRRRSLRRRAS